MKYTIGLVLICLASIVQLYADTIPQRGIGFAAGYLRYSSIDCIVNPYIYSGQNMSYSFSTFYRNQKHFRQFDFTFSFLNKEIAHVNIPDSYSIVGYDNNNTYSVASNEWLKKVPVRFFVLQYSYSRRMGFFNSFQMGDFYWSLSNINQTIFKNDLSYMELIAFGLYPGLKYRHKLFEKYYVSCDVNILLASITIRRPYAGVDAQLSDVQNVQTFWSSVKANNYFNLPNNHLDLRAQICLERAIGRRFSMFCKYLFEYSEVKRPRVLQNSYGAFNLGIYYNFYRKINE
ncbi:MAG TPA: hypothetical protein PK252_04230 [Bacteroidales bacterium]|nr:hypothetical protein [Bacteroidales bacterium]